MPYDDYLGRILGQFSPARFGVPRINEPMFPALKPEEESSVLGNLADYGLRGLAYVGESLDKALGGRAIRGVLGGRPEELASIIPFSDTLGITDSQNQVSGRDLLAKAGMASPSDKGFDLFDPATYAGIATEIALDPGTYLTFGGSALTKAGFQAAKQGKLPAKISDRLAQGLGGHAAIGLPFIRESAGQIPLDLGFIKKAIDYTPLPKIGEMAGKAAEYTGLADAWRSGRAMFDPTVMEQTHPVAQRIAPEIYQAKQLAEAEARGAVGEVLQTLGTPAALEDQTLRHFMEGSIAGPLPQHLDDAAARLRPAFEGAINEENAWSIPTKKRPDYFPRQKVEVESEKGLRSATSGQKPFDPTHPFMIGREEIFDVPGGGPVLEEIVRRKDVSTSARTLDVDSAANVLASQYGIKFPQAKKLADFLGTLGPERLEKGLFNRLPVADAADRLVAGKQRVASAEVVQKTLAETASPNMIPGGMKVADVMRELGFNHELASIGPKTAQLLGSKLDWFVDGDTAEALLNGAKAFLLPKQVQGFAKVWDNFTNLFKGAVTSPWPGFHARNAISAAWQNWVLGVKDPQAYTNARALLQGQTFKGIEDIPIFKAAGLTAEQAREEISKLAYAHRVTGGHYMDLLGKQDDEAFDLLRQVPGLAPSKTAGAEVVDYAKGLIPKSKEDIFPKGLLSDPHAVEKIAPVKAGRRLGQEVEDTVRLAGFIDLLKKGNTPEIAAAKVRAAQVDYSALTGFERQVMRRLMPFYTFTRKNLPFQIQQILQHPGGKVGTAIKAAGTLRGDEGSFLPEYLGSGTSVALPLGEEREGVQSFLTQLGLPFEQVFEVLDPSNPLRSMQRMASQLNPIVKMPAEYFTGKQFYSGRELSSDSLYGPTGITGLDQLIMHSPASRAYTTARTALDERKHPLARLLNIGTGARISDVDIAKQRDMVIRDLLKQRLGEVPEVDVMERLYVRPENLPLLSPEEAALMQLMRTMEQRAREAAKKRKESQ